MTKARRTRSGAPVPRFSIVFETFNITRADLEELDQALTSLYQGDLTPSDAAEVLVLDNGTAPPEAFAWLAGRFPNLEICEVPARLGLGDLRGLTLHLPREDLVLIFDSDCVFEPGWLDVVLDTMASRPEVPVLSGEITVDVTGPYSLAIAIAWIFPRFSEDRAPVPCDHYLPNACAFRRVAITGCPYPLGLPQRRGQAHVHAHEMRERGLQVWREPRARGRHLLPTVLAALHRFLVIGHDSVEIARRRGEGGRYSLRDRFLDGERRGRVAAMLLRAREVLAEDPWRGRWLPLALPWIAAFVLAYLLGRALTLIHGPTARRVLGIPLTPADLLQAMQRGGPASVAPRSPGR